MQFDDIVNLVIQETGRSDKETQISQYVTFGFADLCRKHPFDSLRKETDTQINVLDTQMQIPADVNQIVELRLLVPSSPTLSYPMELKRKVWFTKQFPNVVGSTITGRPLWCYRDNNQIYFDRKANGVYAVRITYFPFSWFKGATATSGIHDADEALVAYATSRTYRSVQMYEDAQIWFSEYGRLAKELINAVQREIGVRVVADEWTRRGNIQPNQPWLDPFAGHIE